MKKIIVIGSPGAGKSTFSKKLSHKTGLPLFHLDNIWHKADKTNISRDEFDCRLAEIFEESEWIIDGNYSRTLKTRLNECDTVFFLDYPLEICIAGVNSRIGKPRDDMPWIEDKFDDEFMQWIIDWHKTKRPETQQMLQTYKDEKEIIIFHSRKESEEFLNREM